MVDEALQSFMHDDLAHSGLTAEELKAEPLGMPALKQRIGLENALPCRGGYSIPYFNYDGSPLIDSGIPYERFRLLDIEPGSEIGKYLSPAGSKAHLYIPERFHMALMNSRLDTKVVVITEGEKKAAAACKAGIPCVAIPGITMYRDSEDRDKLSKEIRNFLVPLNDSMQIFYVVVMFDSDGYPVSTKQMPSDEEEAAKYEPLNRGKKVRNRDVFNQAFRFANLIKQSIAGLRVAYTWCYPAFSTTTGPKGGKFVVVEKQGLDDAIQNGQTDDLIKQIETVCERATAGDGEGGYIPLGMSNDGLTVALWSIPQNCLIKTSLASLNNAATLAGICGRSWLEQKFTKMVHDTVEFDVKKASMEIASICANKGAFHGGDRIFGTGVWSPDKREIVINTHNAVYLQDGSTIDRIDENRRELYVNGGAATPPPPPEHIVTDDEYARVCAKIYRDLGTWSFEKPVVMDDRLKNFPMGPSLVMGWMTMVVYLGLLERRPHMWVVGPRGSGKSRLLSYLAHMLIGYLKHTDMGSSMTEAGMRQFLQNSCFAFIIDELEKENTENGQKLLSAIEQVLKLMRAAYSASSTVFKGTADQKGIEFRIMTSVMAASIAEPALEPADRSRIVMVKLSPRVGATGQPPENLTPEESAIFFWGTIQRWGRFQHIYDLALKNWNTYAGNGDSREAETFGTVIAASMISNPKIQTDEQILTVLKVMIICLQPQLDEMRQGTAEHEIILNTLLTKNIPVEYHECDENGREHINRETHSIGGLVSNLVNGGTNSDEIRALGLVGLRVWENDGNLCLAIAHKHSGLTDLLKGSRYNKNGAWAGGLKDVPGSTWDKTVRINGMSTHCVMVPARHLALQPDNKATMPMRPNSFDTAHTIN
ncbi:DUF3854 domain-containing protein [Acidithiobacillus thiooxidans]|uniref:DUF3854 domain-containing protein n=1 Tax=Acidithiobacillus thiooxidans TaxID=930 RepID=UPI0009D99A0C|nr:DUF3854 domain-containing protein [Acidithiobacillus thiooxidans]